MFLYRINHINQFAFVALTLAITYGGIIVSYITVKTFLKIECMKSMTAMMTSKRFG